MRWYRFTKIAFFLIAVTLPSLVRAEEVINLRVSPVILEDSAAPGESIRTQLTLDNQSSGLLPLRGTAFAVRSKGEEGDIEIVHDSPIGEIQDWFMFEEDVILDSKNIRILPIRINVPKSAKPGTHTAALFFKPFQPGITEGSDSNVFVQSQVAVLVFITVKGELTESGVINTFTAPLISVSNPVPLEIGFENTGNVAIRPRTTVRLYSLLGRQIDEFSGELQGSLTTMPGGSRSQQYTWSRSTLPGLYRADVEVASGTFIATRSRWLLVVPLPFMVVLVPLIVWGLWAGLYPRRMLLGSYITARAHRLRRVLRRTIGRR